MLCHLVYLKKDNMNKVLKKEIKRLKKKGFSKNRIARRIGISNTTVKYYLEPEFKKKQNEYYRIRYITDKSFRDKMKEANRLHQNELYRKGLAWCQKHPILIKKRRKEYNKKKKT